MLCSTTWCTRSRPARSPPRSPGAAAWACRLNAPADPTSATASSRIGQVRVLRRPAPSSTTASTRLSRLNAVVQHGLAQRLARRGGRGDRPGPRAAGRVRRGDGPARRAGQYCAAASAPHPAAASPHRDGRCTPGTARPAPPRAASPPAPEPRRPRGRRERARCGTTPVARRSRMRLRRCSRARLERSGSHATTVTPARVLGDLDVTAERREPLDVARQLRRSVAAEPGPSAGSSTRTPTAARRGARGARAARCCAGRPARCATAAAAK